MNVTFITRKIVNKQTGKTKEWIVDAYMHDGRKIPNWYRAKTLKACRLHLANQTDF